MSEKTKKGDGKDQQLDSEAAARVAFCPNMAHIKTDLGLLYLKNNASARNKFGDTYPEIAHYVFGDELIAYDHEGCTDWEHRSELEEGALQRRFELLQVLEEVEDKSVKSGSLEKEYVEKILDHFGAGVCSFIYTEEIIERVRPGLLKTLEDEKENKGSEDGESGNNLRQQAQADLDNDTSLLAAEQEILASKPKDTTNVPIPDIEDEEEDNKEPENPAPDPAEIEKELGDIKPIDMHDGEKEGGKTPEAQGEAVPSDVARQSVEIGTEGAENKEPPAAPTAPAAPEQSKSTDSNPAPSPPESKPEAEAGANSAPPPPDAKTESNPAPPAQSSTPASPPPPPSEPEQKAPQAPDIKKTDLGPPLKEDAKEKKVAPAIFGNKPDFANMKTSDAPKEEEAQLQSYKDLFNKLAAKAA